MKLSIFSLFLMFSVIAFPVKLENITNAIEKGDAEVLSKYFCDDVEVFFQDEGDLYPKEEAKNVVKAFFETNAPKLYTQMHDGSSKGTGGKYSIGVLETSTNKYRISLYLEKVSDDYLIREMRFRKE